MRPIDADAIKLPKGFFEEVDNVPKFYEWLNEQPTIEPAKHGKLIASEETNSGGLIRMVCSECNRVVYSTYGVRLSGIQFCPYCGARMERSEE